MRNSLLLVGLASVAILLTPWLACATNSNSAEHNGLYHFIETDKSIYAMYEPVEVYYEVTNVTEEPMFIEFGCLGHALFVNVYDPSVTMIWSDPQGCLDVVWSDILDPGASYLKETVWDMFSYLTWQPIDEEGTYTVEGELGTFYSDLHFALDVQIEVLEAATPVSEDDLTWSTIKALFR